MKKLNLVPTKISNCVITDQQIDDNNQQLHFRFLSRAVRPIYPNFVQASSCKRFSTGPILTMSQQPEASSVRGRPCVRRGLDRLMGQLRQSKNQGVTLGQAFNTDEGTKVCFSKASCVYSTNVASTSIKFNTG